MVGQLKTPHCHAKTGKHATVIRGHSRDKVDESLENKGKLLCEIVIVTSKSFIHAGFMDNNVDEVEEKMNFQTTTRSIIINTPGVAGAVL